MVKFIFPFFKNINFHTIGTSTLERSQIKRLGVTNPSTIATLSQIRLRTLLSV